MPTTGSDGPSLRDQIEEAWQREKARLIGERGPTAPGPPPVKTLLQHCIEKHELNEHGARMSDHDLFQWHVTDHSCLPEHAHLHDDLHPRED